MVSPKTQIAMQPYTQLWTRRCMDRRRRGVDLQIREWRHGRVLIDGVQAQPRLAAQPADTTPSSHCINDLVVRYMEQQKKGEQNCIYGHLWEGNLRCSTCAHTQHEYNNHTRWWPQRSSGVSRDLRFSGRRRQHPSALSCLTTTHTLSLQCTSERAREEAPRIKHIKKRIRSWTKSHSNGLLQQK